MILLVVVYTIRVVPKAPYILLMYGILGLILAFAFYLFDIVRSVYRDIRDEKQSRPNAPIQKEAQYKDYPLNP